MLLLLWSLEFSKQELFQIALFYHRILATLVANKMQIEPSKRWDHSKQQCMVLELLSFLLLLF